MTIETLGIIFIAITIIGFLGGGFVNYLGLSEKVEDKIFDVCRYLAMFGLVAQAGVVVGASVWAIFLR